MRVPLTPLGCYDALRVVERPTFLGKYELLEVLGRGGMAVVHLARGAGPAGFCRLFAVKTIHDQFAEEQDFIRMFLDEARLAGRIHHPNAVPVLDVGTDRDRHFIAMDYVNGENLFAMLKQAATAGERLPISLVLMALEGIGEALHAAHELTGRNGEPLEVVHRDVSPHNILIGYDGIARITDFGVAKAADRLTHTDSGFFKGKLAYMAPEQLEGTPIDRRVDIFTLGIVLWECLAGQPLFRRDTRSLTLHALSALDIPPIRSIRPDVPEALATVTATALAGDPKARYGTAREMTQAMRAVAATHGLLAAPADLEQYMQSLFRAAYDRRRWTIHRALNTDPAPAAQREADPVLPQAQLSVSIAEAADSARIPPSRSRTIAVAALLAIACAVVVQVTASVTEAVWDRYYPNEPQRIGVVMPEPEPTDATESTPPIDPPPVTLKPRTPPSAPATVQLSFRLNPESAAVRVDGKVVEPPLTRAKSTAPLAVTVSAKGFRRRALEVIPDRDQVIDVTLVRRKNRTLPAKPSRPRTPAARNKPEDPGKHLVSGQELWTSDSQ